MALVLEECVQSGSNHQYSGGQRTVRSLKLGSFSTINNSVQVLCPTSALLFGSVQCIHRFKLEPVLINWLLWNSMNHWKIPKTLNRPTGIYRILKLFHQLWVNQTELSEYVEFDIFYKMNWRVCENEFIQFNTSLSSTDRIRMTGKIWSLSY